MQYLLTHIWCWAAGLAVVLGVIDAIVTRWPKYKQLNNWDYFPWVNSGQLDRMASPVVEHVDDQSALSSLLQENLHERNDK